MINFTPLYINTPIPFSPRIINDNFQAVQNYLNLFYDSSNGIIVVPVQTSGRVKASKGEFTTVVVDNLTVRTQYTNLYNNITTIDSDYYNTYIGDAFSYRVANPSTFENTKFKYIYVAKPYYKITNDVSIAFLVPTFGQQIQVLFDVSTAGRSFSILMDPSVNGTFKTLSISANDSSMAWLTLISVDYDASWGTTWAMKQWNGNFHIK